MVTELVITEQKRPTVTAEDEMDVALCIHNKRGPAMIIESSGVHLIRGNAHGIEASPYGASPSTSRMRVCSHVRILMRPLVGDIGHAVEILGGRMLHVTDGASVAVVAKMVTFLSHLGAKGTAEAER